MNLKLLVASIALASAGITSAHAQQYYNSAPRHEDVRVRYVPAPVVVRRVEPVREVVVAPAYCAPREVALVRPGYGRPIHVLPVRRGWGWW